ncbi:hypothetical protein [Pseudoalteromonas sp.]|uniref:hypothetical protein n=1 Tax=Pseudoalteromonas sp. TaxID=53249 RepID=UPI002627F21B|nr:hypothetical protein [Pseudoalteromonas sp.]MCP4585318.1 hypothetical protein [Pseudoalteromonas sp.]
MDVQRNIISTTLMPVEQTQYTLQSGASNPFKGALTASNTDTTFSEITTGDAHEISDLGLGSELVTDGALENWTADDPDSWEKTESGSSTVTEDNADEHGGSACALFTIVGSDNALMKQDTTYISGSWYRVIFWAKGSTTNQINIRDDTGNVGGLSEVIDLTTSWKEYTFYFQANDASDTLYFKRTTPTTWNFRIDDVSVKPVSSITFAGGSELHTDANAASIGNEADATTGWTNGGCSTFQSQSGTKSNGSYAIEVVASSGGNGFYKDIGTDFGLSDGDWVTLSVDLRHSGSGGNWGCGLGSVATSVNTLTYVTLDNTDTSFVTYSNTFQYDSDYRYFVNRELSVTNDGGVFLDNFSCKILHDYNTTDNDVISIGGCEGLGAELITASNDRDFTTDEGNWEGHSGGVVADGTNKLQCTMDASGPSGCKINVNTYGDEADADDGYYRKITADIWAGTTAKTTFLFSYGNASNYEEITISGSQTTFTIYLKSNVGSPYVTIFCADSDSGTFFVDDVSVKKVVEVKAKPYRIASIDSSGVCTLMNADFSDMAANISSAYATSASLTNYTEGDGWKADCDVDPTPINSGTLTLGEVYFIEATESNNFYTGCAIYEYFTSDGTETCDSNNIVVHITDTFATCDGGQSAVTDLVNTEFSPTAGKGYKTTKIYESIDAGGSTSYVGSRAASERTVAATYEEKIKAIDTTGATESGTSDLECKITSYTVEEYGG